MPSTGPGTFSCTMNRNLLVSLLPIHENMGHPLVPISETETKYIYFKEDKQEHSFPGLMTFIAL